MNSLFFEKNYPFGLSVVSLVAIVALDDILGFIDAYVSMDENVFEASVAVGAIFAGFVTLSRDTVQSCSDPRMIRILKSSYGKLLKRYINSSFGTSVSFVVVSFVFLLLKNEVIEAHIRGVFCTWFFFFCYMILSFRRNRVIISNLM